MYIILSSSYAGITSVARYELDFDFDLFLKTFGHLSYPYMSPTHHGLGRYLLVLRFLANVTWSQGTAKCARGNK